MKQLLTLLLFLVFCVPCFSQTRPDWLDIKNKPPMAQVVDFVALGADKTGAVDCTTLLHSAIASGGYLYLPEGDYKINAEANGLIDVAKSITIFGPGRLMVATSSYTKFAIGINLTSSNTSATVQGITIEGGSQLHFGIYIAQTAGKSGNIATVQGCKIYNCHAQGRNGVDAAGVVVVGEFEIVDISKNVIREVTRQVGADNNRSANGILVSGGAPVVTIKNNAVSGIHSSPADVEHGNADGIAVFNDVFWLTPPRDPDMVPGVTEISNNELYNCEGRFIKVAAHASKVSGNRIVHDAGVSMNAFEGIVSLRGACTITDNTYVIGALVTLGNQYSCFSVENQPATVSNNNLVTISGNKVYLKQPLAVEQRIFSNYIPAGDFPESCVTISNNSVLGEGAYTVVRNKIIASGTLLPPPITIRVTDNYIASGTTLVFWDSTGTSLATHTNTLAMHTIITGNVATGTTPTNYILHTNPETNSVGKVTIAANSGWSQNRVTVGELRVDSSILQGSNFFYLPSAGSVGLSCASGTVPASFSGFLNGVYISNPHGVLTLTRTEGAGIANINVFTQAGTSYFGAIFP